MSKKRKANISVKEDDKEISNSTAKKSHRKKTQLAEDSSLTTGSSSNATIAGTNQECIGNSPENSDRSFTKEDKTTSVQKKELEHIKVFVSPSQGKKWVPVFRKTKKILTEKLEKNSGEAAAISLEQVQRTDRNVPNTTKRDAQNTITSSESLQLEDSLAPKVEEAEEQVVFPREDLNKTLNINMQDHEDITNLNSDNANSGLFGSHEGIRIEPNLQVSISEEEMPDKHATYKPDNGVNGLEKRELSFTCPLAENSAITCIKQNITDYIEGSPKEEKHLNVTMEQNKAIQDVTDDVKEAGCCESERGKDYLVESMPLQPCKENSIILLPLVTNISIHTPEDQSNCLCRSSEDEQRRTDARETDQYPNFQTGQTVEENKFHSTSEIFEPRAISLTSTKNEQVIEQGNLWMCDKPVEERDRDKTREYSNPLQVDTFFGEQNSIRDQDADWKVLPEIQPVNIYLEKEGDICEPNCKQLQEPEEDDSIILLPLVTNISVHTPEGQSNCLCRSSEDELRSTDARETDQYPNFQTGQTVEENKFHSTSEIFEPGAISLISTNSERAIEQGNLWMCDKPVEERDRDKTREYSNPLQVDTFVGEQNSIRDQDADWKDLPEIQPVNIYLEKEGDICEPNCKQLQEPEEDDISESRKISMQEVICNEERQMIKQEAEVKATPPKSFTASPDPKPGVLLTAEEKENCCENLLPDIEQSNINACDLIHNEIKKTISCTDVDQQNVTNVSETEETSMENSLFSTDTHINIKKEMVTSVKNESMVITTESGLSSAEVLSVLEAVDDSVRETDANPEAQSNSPVSRINACAPSGLDMDQACPSYTDPLSLEVEFLPDSELQTIFESHSFEFPHKASILDNPHKHFKHESDVCSAGEQSGTKIPAPEPNKTHANNARDQLIEICDQSRQEDATDVVCGLIKELSNLNRLTMSMHRDLDSFKRLKFRRNRQSNKLQPHSVNNMTSTLSTVRKKREL